MTRRAERGTFIKTSNRYQPRFRNTFDANTNSIDVVCGAFQENSTEGEKRQAKTVGGGGRRTAAFGGEGQTKGRGRLQIGAGWCSISWAHVLVRGKKCKK